MTRKVDRRSFVKSSLSAAVAATTCVLPRSSRGQTSGANGKLQCAFVGVGGKGAVDLAEVTADPRAVAVALCDVDEHTLSTAASKHRNVKTYRDWREMLGRPGIDAVVVTTPDHMHAPIAVTAMRQGMHIYCQKPLTHSVWEARLMGRVAAEKKVVTQMGLQHHSLKFMKTGVQAIRDGAIGNATAIHGWTDRPIWPQAMRKPSDSKPAPNHLDWDKWLGVAPKRDFGDGYHPFNWRGWEDFGTGALGDMGCHTLDPAMTALELGPVRNVVSNGTPPNGQSFPTNSVVYYVVQGSQHTEEEQIPLTWYDGGNKPTPELVGFTKDWQMPDNGCVVVGTTGSIFISFDQLPTVAPNPKKLEIADDVNHYHQWIDACHGNGKTTTPFDAYSSPLTELVLLGNVALRFPGKRLKWDSDEFRFPNLPEADAHLRRQYREGWHVEGLG